MDIKEKTNQIKPQSTEVKQAVFALSTFTDLEDLTPSELSQTVSYAKLQKAKDLLDKAMLESKDIDKLIASFLKTLKSVHTRIAYKLCLKNYSAYCESQNIHMLTITPQQADLYASHLRESVTVKTKDKKSYSASKANININAVSSFYVKLIKWEVVTRTPFIKVTRASKEAKVHQVPTQDEIDTIIKNAPIKLKQPLLLLAKTGLRVGAIKEIKVQKRKFTTMSKGKITKGTLPNGISKADILSMQSNKNLTNQLQRYLTKKGTHPHALRHSFAVNLYKMSLYDVNTVMRALGHSDLKVTTTYLASLNV